jgi:hypothetical protein
MYGWILVVVYLSGDVTEGPRPFANKAACEERRELVVKSPRVEFAKCELTLLRGGSRRAH